MEIGSERKRVGWSGGKEEGRERGRDVRIAGGVLME